MGSNSPVRTGEVHGFLGPNGAGKSTTIRILLGLMRADAGEASLLGGDPWRDATALHRRLAYVPGDVSLWPNLTGGEVIDLIGWLRGGIDSRRRASLLERFDLDPRKKCRRTPKAIARRWRWWRRWPRMSSCSILDEPTSGLDPLMEAIFRQCITEERGRGRTVLLSSHILAEVEALCDRVSIIRSGRTVENGTLAELRHLTRTAILWPSWRARRLVYRACPACIIWTSRAIGCASGGPRCAEPALRELTNAGVISLVSQPPTLEELFMRHYETGQLGT